MGSNSAIYFQRPAARVNLVQRAWLVQCISKIAVLQRSDPDRKTVAESANTEAEDQTQEIPLLHWCDRS
jgi:hypothetical protein